MFVCSASTSLLIWVWITTSLASTRAATTDFANSDVSGAAVVGLRLVGYTRLRRCEFTDWLLQHCSCWCTKDSNWQVTACAERRCARRHRHSEVWSRPGSDTTWRTSLTRLPDRMFFKLAVTVHRCLNGRAPPYLSDYSVPVASADTRRHLRSTNCQLLAVLRYRLNTYGRRAFSVAGPTAWNSLPDCIRDPTISGDCFRRLLKTYLFARY